MSCSSRANDPGGRSAKRGRRPGLRSGPGALRGFSLLELLLSVSILAASALVTYLAFSTGVRAWRRGLQLTDELHHGDFVMDQLVMALRSAYYPDTDDAGATYGFWLEDNGAGEEARDVISWVKLGSALAGREEGFEESPHRVEFSLEEDEEGALAVAVRAWRVHGQPEDFEPEDVIPVFLSRSLTGFNCSPAYPFRDSADEEIEWLDEWEHSNCIPTAVELTIYLPPVEEGEEPVQMKRVVGIPVAPLSLPSTPWSS